MEAASDRFAVQSDGMTRRRAVLFFAAAVGASPILSRGISAQENQPVADFVKYDDASWHYDGDFPEGLPVTAGGTHMAILLAWLVLNDLGSDLFRGELSDELAALRSRTITPSQWLFSVCDEKFSSNFLSAEGNQFTVAYYADALTMRDGPGSYLDDYSLAFADAQTLYHVPDSWQTYDKFAPVIAARFEEWRGR